MQSGERGACPGCLLHEIPGQQALAALLAEWIAALPESVKADGARLSARLSACRACAHLRKATCGLCGCYVELRAAQIDKTCPDLPDRWQTADSFEEERP